MIERDGLAPSWFAATRCIPGPLGLWRSAAAAFRRRARPRAHAPLDGAAIARGLEPQVHRKRRSMPKWLNAALAYIAGWLEFQLRYHEQPGCAIAVGHKGKVVLEEAFGYADLSG